MKSTKECDCVAIWKGYLAWQRYGWATCFKTETARELKEKV